MADIELIQAGKEDFEQVAKRNSREEVPNRSLERTCLRGIIRANVELTNARREENLSTGETVETDLGE